MFRDSGLPDGILIILQTNKAKGWPHIIFSSTGVFLLIVWNCLLLLLSLLLLLLDQYIYCWWHGMQRQKTYLWTYAPSEDSDQHAHSRSPIRILTRRTLDRQGCIVSPRGQRRPWSDCADAQAHLSACWAHMLECRFVCWYDNRNLTIWVYLYSFIFTRKDRCNIIKWHLKLS